MSFMPLIRICTIVLVSCVFFGCAPSHMIEKGTGPDILTVKPDPEKSALVIARTTSFGGAITFETYLDKKMIGTTKGKGYFIKKNIDPGKHYLTAVSENFFPILINFESNKTYYYQQEVRMGIWRARVEMVPESPEHIKSEMDDMVTYYEYNEKDPGEDMSEEDYKEHVDKASNIREVK